MNKQIIKNIEECISKLDEFSKLKDNWDSYGAAPISPKAITKAKELLASVYIFPTKRSGISIEGELEDLDYEIEIDKEGNIISFWSGKVDK